MTLQTMEVVACPVCKEKQATQVRTSGDIVKCSGCDLVYLRTRPIVAELEKHYQAYASTPGSHMALPKTIEQIKTTPLRRNNIMSDILAFTGNTRRGFMDIGSGWGAFLLNAREHGFAVAGVEICKEMADFAMNVLGIWTVSKQLEEGVYGLETVQVMSLLHSLEHLPNQSTALGYIHKLLEPGGIICGIVPNFDSWASNNHREKWDWLDPVVHYVHFTPTTLQKTLWQFGFHTLKMYTATEDYNRNVLPVAASLQRIEEEGHGEEIRFFAQKL